MHVEICDYCGERWPKHKIKLTRRPNDEDVYIQLCDQCLADILNYVESKKKVV